MRNFNKSNTRLLGIAMQGALAAVGEEFGVSIRFRGGTVADALATLKFEVRAEAAPGGAPVESQESIDFKRNACLFGLQPDDLGHTFCSFSKKYRVLGANLKRSRFPIVCEEVATGRQFKFSPDAVRHGLKDSRAA